MSKEPIIIVGAGQAAVQFIDSVRKAGFEGELILIGDELHLPYQRPPLSKGFLGGKITEERLPIKPASFYEKNNVTMMLGELVTSINPDEDSISLKSGETISYGTLVFATGSRVRPLPVSGADLRGVHYVRTLDDINTAKTQMENTNNIAIIGAGFIGLEVAAVLSVLGKTITVIEAQSRVMERVIPPEFSTWYQNLHKGHGVDIQLERQVAALTGEGTVTGINLASGDTIDADMIFIGIGIISNVELASDAGMDVDNGITVDDKGFTSDPNIMAIGECSNHPNRFSSTGRARLESVQNAVDQAKVAALALMGEDVSYDDVPWFWSEQYDTRLQIAGLSSGYDQMVIRGDMDSGSFSLMYFRDGNLIAVDSMNNVKDHMAARKIITQGVMVDPVEVTDPEVPLKTFLPPKG